MDEYYEEDDYVQEQEFEQEFGQEVNVFERVGIRNEFIDINIDTEKNRTQKTPIERFVENINAIILDLMHKSNIFYDKDITLILESISLLDNPSYKNPTAFILGYFATNGGNKIDKNKLKKTFDIIKNKEILDTSITPPDIIRYCRLWLNLRK